MLKVVREKAGYILAIMLWLVDLSAQGQKNNQPYVRAEGQRLQEFIPAGWKLLDSASSDLNKDGLKDIVMIIQSIKNENTSDIDENHQYASRNLLILWRNPGGGFKLAARNNEFIAEHDDPNMDDPYQDIIIEKGVLKISFSQFFSVGSWHIYGYDYVFRYQNDEFTLIGHTHTSLNRGTMESEEYSYNYSTKKRSHTIETDNDKKTTWSNISIQKLKTLNDMTSPYQME